jgi:hypothetical protein
MSKKIEAADKCDIAPFNSARKNGERELKTGKIHQLPYQDK